MLVRSDLDFILEADQDRRSARRPARRCQDLIPNIRLAYGLRTVDGSENNLLNIGGFDQTEFGAADTTFPRLLTPVFQTADVQPAISSARAPAARRRRPMRRPAASCSTADPRTISNLIVDQTANNPAASPPRPADGGSAHRHERPRTRRHRAPASMASSAPPTTSRSISSRTSSRTSASPRRSTPGSPSSASSSITASIS